MNLYLTEKECNFLSTSVVGLIEQLKEGISNQRINWNPEARKLQKEMIKAGTSLRIKLVRLGINMDDLPSYNDGDGDEFLTKQS